MLQSVVPGVVITDCVWAIACLPTAPGVQALANYANAAYVATTRRLGRDLLHSRSAGLFDFEPGSPIDATAEAALARLVERAPMVANVVDLTMPDLDANLQSGVAHGRTRHALPT